MPLIAVGREGEARKRPGVRKPARKPSPRTLRVKACRAAGVPWPFRRVGRRVEGHSVGARGAINAVHIVMLARAVDSTTGPSRGVDSTRAKRDTVITLPAVEVSEARPENDSRLRLSPGF